jgi:hypothetical protein
MQQNAQTKIEACASLRQQFRAAFRTMAARGTRWHVHAGSVGVVLMEQGVHADYDAPILVSNVQAMTEDRAVIALCDAIDRQARGA